jgi:hypothetical protein
LRLRGTLLRGRGLLLSGAFENLLENFTENIHRHASE